MRITVLLICLFAFPAWAVKTVADPLAKTDAEAEALVALDNGKLARARTLAEKSLGEKKTFLANYILAMVQVKGEGRLARAAFLMERAKKMLLIEFGRTPKDPQAQRWHKRILLRQQSLHGLMDRRERQLATLDEHDALYRPKRTASRIWPLLKLARFDEAREIGQKLIHDDRSYVRERAYNGLMAVEEEAGNRRESYEWGIRGLAETRSQSCIIATNLALGARRAFKFAETIGHDKTALKAGDGSCPTSPHAQLAVMYLMAGEFQQSLSSLKALRETPREPDMVVQNEMVIRARLVELLLALGAFEDAELRARQIITAPDRAGMLSASPEILEMSNNILAWSVFNVRLNQLRERIATRPIWDTMPLRYEVSKLEMVRWQAEREARRLGGEPKVLKKHVRPYYTDVMPWYGGDMVAIFGDGVITKAIDDVLKVEKGYPSEAKAFLDALHGERAWRNGGWTEARRYGGRLLSALPKEAKLLRSRIRSWLADTLYQMGDGASAAGHFHAVLDFYPTALRQLDIALPVRFESSGPRGEAIRDRLEDSPRFRVANGSTFAVEAIDGGDYIKICLTGQKRYQCSTSLPEKDDEDPIGTAIDTFHDTAFAPKISLTQSDLTSLDGRPVRGDARRAVDSLLGTEKKKKGGRP